MTALGKGIGPPWSQSSGRSGSPATGGEATRYSTSSAPIRGPKPRNPNAGGGGHGSGKSGGGKGRGRGRSGGFGGSCMEGVRATIRGDTGTQDFKVPGFGTPVAAIFVMTRNTEEGATPHIQYSIGATDGSNHWVVSGWVLDAGITTQTGHRATTDEIFMMIDSATGTLDAEGNFDSFITDGVRINVSVVGNPAERLLTVFLIGGNGVTAAVGSGAGPAGSATVTYTPGLQLNALFLATALLAMDDAGGGAALLRLGFGSWDGATLRQCGHEFLSLSSIAIGSPEGVVTSSVIVPNRNQIGNELALDNVTSTEFDLVSAGADGSLIDIGWLAINLGAAGEAWAGIVDSPTSTGKRTLSGPSFTAANVLLAPNMFAAVNTKKVDAQAEAGGFAGISEAAQFAHAWIDIDAAANTTSRSQARTVAVTLDSNNGDEAYTDAFDAVFDKFTTSGVSLDFSNVDGTARKWPALFMKR